MPSEPKRERHASDPALRLVVTAEMAETRLAALTRDLIRDLARSGVDARATEHPVAPGERGLGLMLGEITIQFLAHGGGALLAECLKAYVIRERTLKIQILGGDGKQIAVVDAQNATSGARLSALPAREAQA